MPHLLPSDPQRCRLEVLFRLLRHDVVAPLAAALQQFRSLGGLGWLQQRDRRMQQQQVRGGLPAVLLLTQAALATSLSPAVLVHTDC